jgi:hypothetical protein
VLERAGEQRGVIAHAARLSDRVAHDSETGTPRVAERTALGRRRLANVLHASA